MGCGEENNPYEKLDYLTIIPLERDLVVRVYSAYYMYYDGDVESYTHSEFEYKIGDNRYWTLAGGDYSVDYAPEGLKINVPLGSVLQLRADLDTFINSIDDTFSDDMDYMHINCDEPFAVCGTPISLLNEDLTRALTIHDVSQCCRRLFQRCTTLQEILNPKTFLPATSVPDNAYREMFINCTGLINAPELPAMELGYSCYYQMFTNCTSLKTAPKILPATTLYNSCYYGMFRGCESLVKAPKLPATKLPMYCYSFMFNDCTSLTSAPDISITTVNNECCAYMFGDCTSLVNAPKILSAMTLEYACYMGMFRNCISLVNAPELPATTLTTSCYGEMFEGCISLNYIKMLATDISGNYCLSDWVSGVASTGTFVKASSMNSLPTGEDGIPSGWTVING